MPILPPSGLRPRLWCAGLLLLLAACGGGGDTTAPTPPTTEPPVPPTPAITLTASAPSAASVQQGDSATVTLTIARSGGFAGDVVLAIDSASSDMFTVLTPATVPAGASTAQLQLHPSIVAPVGVYVVRVRASGAGVSTRTASVSLTVTPRPVRFSLVRKGTTALTVIRRGVATLFELILTREEVSGYVRLDVADALPRGVYVAFAPDSTIGGTSAVSLLADSTAVPGTYTNTFRMRAPGDAVTATVAIAYTVLPDAGVQFALDQPTVSVGQGGNRELGITLTFAPVRPFYDITPRGMPPGVTVSASGRATGTLTDRLTVSFSATNTVSPGVYPIWLVLTDRTNLRDSVSVPLTVTAAPAGGDITMAFCGPPAAQPIWLGSGSFVVEWTRHLPDANGRFVFSLPTEIAYVMWVTQAGADDYGITVVNAVRAEFRELTERGCLDATSRTLSTTISGGQPGDELALAIGAQSTRVAAGAAPVLMSLPQLPAGPVDVAAARWRRATPMAPLLADRVFVNRGLDPTGTTLGPIDLGAALVPDALTIPVSGAHTGDSVTVASTFHTAGGTALPLGLSSATGGSGALALPARAVPASARIAGDLHAFTASSHGVVDGEPVARTVTRLTATPSAEPLTLGTASATLTSMGANSNGTWARYSASTMSQPDYLRLFRMDLTQQSGATRRRFTFIRTAAGANLRDRIVAVPFRTVEPDGASGWNTLWEPRIALPVAWSTTSFGWDATNVYRAPLADGVVWRSTTRSGVWSPP